MHCGCGESDGTALTTVNVHHCRHVSGTGGYLGGLPQALSGGILAQPRQQHRHRLCQLRTRMRIRRLLTTRLTTPPRVRVRLWHLPDRRRRRRRGRRSVRHKRRATPCHTTPTPSTSHRIAASDRPVSASAPLCTASPPHTAGARTHQGSSPPQLFRPQLHQSSPLPSSPRRRSAPPPPTGSPMPAQSRAVAWGGWHGRRKKGR
jgi:hypothetical protein